MTRQTQADGPFGLTDCYSAKASHIKKRRWEGMNERVVSKRKQILALCSF